MAGLSLKRMSRLIGDIPDFARIRIDMIKDPKLRPVVELGSKESGM